MFTRNESVQRFVGGFLERMWFWFISGIQFWLLSAHKDKQDIRLLKKVHRQRRSLLTAYEAYTLLASARSVQGLEGEMAEVGVFAGASARILCELKGDKELFLFDTFQGLPPNAAEDGKIHDEHQYACSRQSVERYLESYDHVHLFQGIFPDSANTETVAKILDGRQY